MNRVSSVLVTTSIVTAAINPTAGAAPAGTGFPYEGDLIINNAPVSGLCDVQFLLFDAAVGGNQIGATHQIDGINADRGSFTAVVNSGNEFGANAFDGAARFLEIAGRSPTGAGPFFTTSPRIELAPVSYALGLNYPFYGTSDTSNAMFRLVNSGQGRSGEFVISSILNTEAALAGETFGPGPAGLFTSQSGETALIAKAVNGGTAVFGDSPALTNGASAIHGRIVNVAGGANTAAVRGQNLSMVLSASGVVGTAGPGDGVRGESLTGRGVYGLHESDVGSGAGVHGESRAAGAGAVGVYGVATSVIDEAPTFGVHGESLSPLGVGVRGSSSTGVEGVGLSLGVSGTASQPSGIGVSGTATDPTGKGVVGNGGIGVDGAGTIGVRGTATLGGYGVKGVAGDNNTIGVYALGFGSPGSKALFADNTGGDGVFATGDRGVVAEGTDYGVVGTCSDANGYGGSFSNIGGGIALRATGNAEVNGTLTVQVLEILGGADLAERFMFSEDAEPGMVVEIDPNADGSLRVSKSAYNSRVAGIISGANDLDAGVVLGEGTAGPRSLPVALSGRVWVHCDTRQKEVRHGDLLTTSDLAGYAMPVMDIDRADGAIIGKAMSSLAQGESGMALVLVNLQ